MIKKSKKCLALSLFLANLVSFMGSPNIHAMDGGCARPERLACSPVDERSLTGLTDEELGKGILKFTVDVYNGLKKRVRFDEEAKNSIDDATLISKILISEAYEKDRKYIKMTGRGNSRMITHEFICEFLDKLPKSGEVASEFKGICSLLVKITGNHRKNEPETTSFWSSVVLLTKEKAYVIDLSQDLELEASPFPFRPISKPFIFTAENYINFTKSIRSSLSLPMSKSYAVMLDDVPGVPPTPITYGDSKGRYIRLEDINRAIKLVIDRA